MEISQEMVPVAFSETLPEDERESFRDLLTWVTHDFSTHRGQVEELLLSGGPLLVAKNPDKQN